MAKIEHAYKLINDGWEKILSGERLLLDIWLTKQNVPTQYKAYFSVKSEGLGGEFALEFCGDPLTDNWSMSDEIEYLLIHNMSNGFISRTSDAYQKAVDLLNDKGVKVIVY